MDFSALNRVMNPRKPHTRNPLPSETVGVRYDSHIVDTIYHNDGRVETIDHGHNVMLNDFLKVITKLLVTGTDKLKYWAVGSGDASWGMAGSKETVRIAVKAACTTTGVVKVTIAGTQISVSVQEGDSTEAVAVKIVSVIQANSSLKNKWTVTRNGSTIEMIYFEEKNLSGNYAYDSGSTGSFGECTVEADGAEPVDIPTPYATETKLKNEVYRKEIKTNSNYPNDGIRYLDANGNKSTNPTNVIEIQLTFTPTEGLTNGEPTAWREFGIVAGGTTALNSGVFMNLKRHHTITKTDTMTVERKIRFTFTNADS